MGTQDLGATALLAEQVQQVGKADPEETEEPLRYRFLRVALGQRRRIPEDVVARAAVAASVALGEALVPLESEGGEPVRVVQQLQTASPV